LNSPTEPPYNKGVASKSYKLNPFRQTSIRAAFSLEVTVGLLESKLDVKYLLKGHLGDIVISAINPRPQRVHGLWNFTCFELFISKKGSNRYVEWNFSPSHDTDYLFFDSYRVLAQSQLQPLSFVFTKNAGAEYVLEAKVDLKRLESFWPGNKNNYELNLAAVLEHATGERSYWALQHPDPQPDFHLRSHFKVTV
jgi:hypothetical protein